MSFNFNEPIVIFSLSQTSEGILP